MNRQHEILIIEDRGEYIKAAEKAADQLDIEIVVCRDYAQALEEIKIRPSGILTDIFFLEEFGTNKKDKAYEVIDKIKQAVSHDIDIMGVARYKARTVYNAVTKVADLFGGDVDFVLDQLPNPVFSNRMNLEQALVPEKTKRQRESLKAIQSQLDEQQPLGVLVAEQAREMGIPYYLLSSYNHHGDKLKGVNAYLQKASLIVDAVECNFGDRDKPEYWIEIFNKIAKAVDEKEAILYRRR